MYTGCVLETKKRYAGWMYESEDAIPKLDAKGIETVRRDTCPIVSDVASLYFVVKENSDSREIFGVHSAEEVQQVSKFPGSSTHSHERNALLRVYLL